MEDTNRDTADSKNQEGNPTERYSSCAPRKYPLSS